MDGGEPDRWSAVAEEWSRLWGALPAPVWHELAERTGIGPGTRVLDVGCGAGELLEFAARLGAEVAGADPAPGMALAAARRVRDADIQVAGFEELPWPDASFDVLTSVNALQFAGDLDDALREAQRVVTPGGRIAIANWAEASRNDLEAVEAAIAVALGEEPLPDDDLRRPGGLERVLAGARLVDVAAGVTEVVWTAADADALVRGILLGEDDATIEERRGIVLDAAAGFRQPGGSYRLVNAFRWAVGTTSAGGHLPAPRPGRPR